MKFTSRAEGCQKSGGSLVIAWPGLQILIDNEVDRNGTLYEAYDFLLPRQIKVRYICMHALMCQSITCSAW